MEPSIIDAKILDVLKAFPFMSYGTMLEKDYLGIIQNCDSQMLSMYIFTDIADASLRNKFIELGTQWWWGSNRLTPINIYFKNFGMFRPYIKHFSRKDFNLEAGPAVSLQEIIARRVRKRQITLIRKL